jgi:hypothetical protein
MNEGFEDENGCSWDSYKDYFVGEVLFGAGFYDEEIADDAVNILKFLGQERSNFYYTDIAKELNLDSKYVAVFLDLFARADLTEYGCSPRGSWLTPKGREVLSKLMETSPDALERGKEKV